MNRLALALTLVLVGLPAFGQTIYTNPGGPFNPATPGPIGGTTPAAGTFTNLTDTGILTTGTPVITGGIQLGTPVATPVNGTFSTSCTGGTLVHGTTYFYRVAAKTCSNTTPSICSSLASTETSLTTGACGNADTSTITVTWGAVTGAVAYTVFGRTTGAETQITASLGTSGLSYTDTGSALSGALPGVNTTVWIDPGGANWSIGHAGAGTLDVYSGATTLHNGPVLTDGFTLHAVDQAATIDSTTGSITTKSTAATARAGWRNAHTRNITHNSSVAVPDCAGGTLSLTVTQFLDSGFATCGTAQTINFPTWQGASGIVQGLPGAPAVGDVVEFTVVSTAAAAVTIGAGTGGTISGTTTLNNVARTFHCRLTSVTASSETATCY